MARANTATKGGPPVSALNWNRIKPAMAVLVSGGEDVLAEEAIDLLRSQLVTADPTLEVIDLTAESYSRGELFTFASPSLFGEAKLIRVAAVENGTDDFILDLSNYLNSPNPECALVLRHRGGIRGKKILDLVRQNSMMLEVACLPLKKDEERQEFVLELFAKANRSISRVALRGLLFAFAGDLRELATACRQLMADSEGEVTDVLVDRYYGGRSGISVFAVADLAITGRYGDALISLRQAIANGSDPVPMVAAFAVKIRTMAKVSTARGSSAQVASELRLAPWQVDRARRDLSGWDEFGLGVTIQALATADAAVKGAERDPIYALERLVTTIAQRGRQVNQ